MGNSSVQDEPRSSRPSTVTDASNIARMEALVLSDMHIKIKEIMDALRLGQDWSMSRSTQMILHELDMSTRWVPHFHTIFQKKH